MIVPITAIRRPLNRRGILAAALSVAIAACGWTPADEQVLVKFFERSRAYDTTLLAPIATVAFDPRVEGVVDRFEILDRRDQSLDGGRLSREARLRAQVSSPAGERSERQLLVTLERAADGAWTVARFKWAG